MMSPVFRPRGAKPRKVKLVKLRTNFRQYFMCSSLLACAIVSLMLSWGALEIENYANRNYEFQSRSGTPLTCFFTNYLEGSGTCERSMKNYTHRMLAYHGIRFDLVFSTPLIMISLWTFWRELSGHWVMILAHLIAWTKFICLAAALTCILIDDPSYMREIFEKSHFGTYESKLLYAFALCIISCFFNIVYIATLIFIPCTKPDKDLPYHVGPNHKTVNLRVQPIATRSKRNKTKVGSKKEKWSNIAVVEAFHSDDDDEVTMGKGFVVKASPV